MKCIDYKLLSVLNDIFLTAPGNWKVINYGNIAVQFFACKSPEKQCSFLFNPRTYYCKYLQAHILLNSYYVVMLLLFPV